jgi:hypothetical protein
MPREVFVTVGTGRDREDIGKALGLSTRDLSGRCQVRQVVLASTPPCPAGFRGHIVGDVAKYDKW